MPEPRYFRLFPAAIAAILAIATQPPSVVRAAEPAMDNAPAEKPGDSSSYDLEPRSSEWEVLFEEGITADEYAKQLDYFGIELGAVAKDGKIQYAAQLSRTRPERRNGLKKDEKRVTIEWKRGTLEALDRKLLTKVGINTQGKKLAHFYSLDAQRQLARLERDFEDRPAAEIKRTRFSVRPLEKTAGPSANSASGVAKSKSVVDKSSGQTPGYEFYVVEQEPVADSKSRSTSTARKKDSR